MSIEWYFNVIIVMICDRYELYIWAIIFFVDEMGHKSEYIRDPESAGLCSEPFRS